MTWTDEVSKRTHGLSWYAQAYDPSWADHVVYGAPSSAIDLEVIDVRTQADWDRIPSTRLTLTVHPPARGVRWLCPLNRTLGIKLYSVHSIDNFEYVTSLGTFQLRRRKLEWPGDSTVTLDIATWDGHQVERMDSYAITSAGTQPGGDT